MIEFLSITDQVPRDLQRKIRGWENEGAASINLILRPDGDVVVLSHSAEAETRRIMYMVAQSLNDNGMH